MNHDDSTLHAPYSQFNNTINNVGVRRRHSRARRDDPLEILRYNKISGASSNSAGRCESLRCHAKTRKPIKRQLVRWVDGKTPQLRSESEDENEDANDGLALAYEGANSRLMWVYGSEGVGKSAFAKWLAQYFDEREQLAASFFFFHHGRGRNHIRKFIPTIAHQIASSFPSAKQRIVEALRDPNSLDEMALKWQWENLVLKPLASINRPILLVIDGLDECTSLDEASFLFECILRSTRRHDSWQALKVLITSRPEPPLQRAFTTFGSRYTHSIKLGGRHDPDIAIFLQSSLAEVHARRAGTTMTWVPAPWPHPDVLHKLSRRARGQFVRATALLSFIDDPVHDPVTQLDQALEGPERFGATHYRQSRYRSDDIIIAAAFFF